jgi:hypothetical protein
MPRPIRPALLAAGLGLLALFAAPAGAAVRPCPATDQAATAPCDQPAEPPCVATPCR